MTKQTYQKAVSLIGKEQHEFATTPRGTQFTPLMKEMQELEMLLAKANMRRCYTGGDVLGNCWTKR